MEAAELKSFLRTGKEFGLQGLLENTILDDLSSMESSKMVDNTSEEVLPTELNKARSLTSDQKSGFGLAPMNSDLHLDMKPEHLAELDSKMIVKRSNEVLLTELNKERRKSVFDEGPVPPLEKNMAVLDKTLEECFDRNPTRTDEKEEESGWQCDKCSNSLSSKEGLLKHQIRLHRGLRYMCDRCPFQANTREKVNRHKQIKHDGLRYKCDQCDYKSIEKRHLAQHIKSKHSRVHKCEHCDHEARTESRLKKHISFMKYHNEQAHQHSANA